jgi:hypothetical protein
MAQRQGDKSLWLNSSSNVVLQGGCLNKGANYITLTCYQALPVVSACSDASPEEPHKKWNIKIHRDVATRCMRFAKRVVSHNVDSHEH